MRGNFVPLLRQDRPWLRILARPRIPRWLLFAYSCARRSQQCGDGAFQSPGQDQELGTVKSAKSECFGDSGPVVTLAALDLYHFFHQTPPPAVEVVGDRLPLCFEVEAADSLPCSRNSQITHKPTLCHGFTYQDVCFNVR